MMAIATLIVLANTEPGAGAIAIAGMSIVAIALTFISLFIATLPRVLEFMERYLPEAEDRHAKRMPSDSSHTDDEAINAAIGFVLYTEIQNQLARERAGSKS